MSPASPTSLFRITDILIAVWLRNFKICEARALRVPECKEQIQSGIGYELKKKVTNGCHGPSREIIA